MNLQMKTIRTRLGMGQKKVADLAGMPVRRYGSYEREERTLSLEDACRIADVFAVSLDELAGRWEYVTSTPAHDPYEREIIDAYRDTDPRGQENILETARREKRAQGTFEVDMRKAE